MRYKTFYQQGKQKQVTLTKKDIIAKRHKKDHRYQPRYPWWQAKKFTSPYQGIYKQ